MTKEDCFYLGVISKPFSYKAEVVLFLDVDNIYQYEDLKYVYLDINNRLIKYDFESLRLHGNKFVAKFKNVTSEEVNILIGRDMYLPIEMLPKLEGNQFYFHEVIGFEVIDKQKGSIGNITEIIDNTTQPIMVINHNDTEVLIPLIDPVIQSVDRDNKTINIIAPEGLIDVYLKK